MLKIRLYGVLYLDCLRSTPIIIPSNLQYKLDLPTSDDLLEHSTQIASWDITVDCVQPSCSVVHVLENKQQPKVIVRFCDRN